MEERFPSEEKKESNQPYVQIERKTYQCNEMEEIDAQKKTVLLKIFKAVMLLTAPYVKNLSLYQFKGLMNDDTVIVELMRLLKMYKKYKGSTD